MQLNDLLIKDLLELDELINKHEEIVIYGAGGVAEAFLQYEHNNGNIEKIQYALVKDKTKNPDKLYAIEVRELKQCCLTEKVLVIVATLEKFHDSILTDLVNCGYNKIKVFNNEVYKQLRWENDYFHDSHLRSEQYEDALKKWYHSVKGYSLDLEHPATFNEKIQWFKLHGVTPFISQLTDKYEVRNWIKEQIGEEYLVSIIGVWNSFDEIDIGSLPQQFVLKCTHGCAWNEIVNNKSLWNVQAAKKRFDKWMKTNYAFRGGLQLQYKDIKPRIIAEQYLENVDGDLYDYKFWCFDGKVEFIMFLSERSTKLKMNNYDINWNLLPFTYDHPNTEKQIAKPDKLTEMIKLAEKLSAGFPHVRVDLYQLNDGTIKFGEMTFTSGNGTCGWSNEDIDYKLGSLIHIR